MKYIYDGERLFKLYTSWGDEASHKKLREWCTENNMKSHRVAKASQMGAFFAMWKWAFKNPEEAYPHYKEWFFASDPDHRILSWQDFLKELRYRGLKPHISGIEQYLRFCEKYGLNKVEMVEDGFGNSWPVRCEKCHKRSIVVVRPGYAKCFYCD